MPWLLSLRRDEVANAEPVVPIRTHWLDMMHHLSLDQLM